MADPFKARTMKRKNVKGLAISAAPKTPKPSEGDSQIPGSLGNNENNRPDTLEIGLEFQLDLRSDDLVVLKELGAGNGGTVSKVMHGVTKVVMARKVTPQISIAGVIVSDMSSADHPSRSERESKETDCSRAPGRARMQIETHRHVLWCVPKRRWRHRPLYGVYGLRVGGADSRIPKTLRKRGLILLTVPWTVFPKTLDLFVWMSWGR